MYKYVKINSLMWELLKYAVSVNTIGANDMGVG